MAKQQTEDELNLRRKARRRLIGAIALTLAVVVILPMVLDSEPKSSGNDIDLSIPDPDKVGAFVPSVAIPEVKLPPASSAVVTGSTPPASEPVKVKPAAAPAPDKSASAKALPAAQKPAEKPASGEGYAAQVGAYANASTAKQELKKLKSWGFKAYTEKVDGNTRVRVGPYPDRDKAEKAGKLLEKHGLHPVIVSTK
ncbi:MAG: SPOR domain-containing protein [Gallionella sp.]